VMVDVMVGVKVVVLVVQRVVVLVAGKANE
jgi:hypothetical protein